MLNADEMFKWTYESKFALVEKRIMEAASSGKFEIELTWVLVDDYIIRRLEALGYKTEPKKYEQTIPADVTVVSWRSHA